MKARLSIFALSILIGAKAHAAQLNATATSSSQFTTGGADRTAVHTVDGSGLDANIPPNHGTNANTMWMTNGDGTFSNGSADPDIASGQLGHITFDLGGVFNVDSFRIWNYNEFFGSNNFSNRGVQTLTISISMNSSGPFTALLNPAGTSTTWTLAQAPGSSSYTGQLFTLTNPFQAEFIRFDIKTNYGADPNTGTNNSLVGLSEVRFFGSAVPEPATWLLLGVAGVTMSILRRRARA